MLFLLYSLIAQAPDQSEAITTLRPLLNQSSETLFLLHPLLLHILEDIVQLPQAGTDQNSFTYCRFPLH